VFLDAQLLQRKFMRAFSREFGLISNPSVFSFSSLSTSGSLRLSKNESLLNYSNNNNSNNSKPANNTNSSALVPHNNPKLILSLKIPKKDVSVNK
jgi:hypothetical protein